MDVPRTAEVEGITLEAVARLSDFLESTFGAVPPLRIQRVAEGCNNATHLVAIDARGVCFGLKAISGHKSGLTGELFAADRVLLLAELSQLLDAPVPLDCVRLADPRGLGPLDGWDAVARRWHGVRLDKIDPAQVETIRSSPERFLRQYGEWFAFGLLFGLFDGKAKNWTWEAADASLGRFDLEACFYPETVPAQLADGLRPFGFRPKLLDGEEPELGAFTEGLRAMLGRFHARRADVQDRLAGYDFSRDFLADWPWAQMSVEDFVAEAVRGIPRS